ncbi:hypothetical protein ACJ2A9_04830 [Anaerobacillus sp. MEB173]|uniref:hypothetical protein n=1 Tax=Anaerobacillus sp. MEB173 TaxID=3383345 RepID=UPI003F8E2414
MARDTSIQATDDAITATNNANDKATLAQSKADLVDQRLSELAGVEVVDVNDRLTGVEESIFTKDAIHSGFVNLGDITYLPTTVNTIRLGKSVANVNGFRVEIPQTDIVLPNAPLTGKENNLVYLKGEFSNYTMSCVIETAKASKLEDLGYVRQSKDKGLYVKDGFYGIPIAVIKRRNSGGYSEQNLNGGRNHIKFDIDLSTSLVNGQSKIFPLRAGFTTKGVQIGDIFKTTIPVFRVVRVIDDSNLEVLGLTSVTNSRLTVDLDTALRPDNLYANIIAQRDLTDLRHQVSLTGVDKNYLLQKEFDRVMRGEGVNEVLHKERYNLERAPHDTPVQLMPTKVATPDGDKWMVNELGLIGRFDSLQGWTNWANGGTLSTNYVLYGQNSLRISSTSQNNGVWREVSGLSNDKYYFVACNVFIESYTSGNFHLWATESGTTNSIPNVSMKVNSSLVGQWQTLRFKITGRSAFRLFIANGTSSTSIIHIDGVRLYEISQADFDKIDVLPEFTGEELAKRFPYVDSVPNVLENLVPTDVLQWRQGGSNNVATNSSINVIGGGTYFVACDQNYQIGFDEIDSSGNKTWKNFSSSRSVTLSSSTVRIDLVIRKVDYSNITPSIISEAKPQLVKGSQPNPVFVPYGKHYLPHDYATGQTKTRLDLSGKRQILSDAQTSENVVDTVNHESNSTLPHIATTQATVGQWSVGDTIKVKSTESVLTGVIDADTAFVQVVEPKVGQTSPITIKVNDVSKLSVGDKLRRFNPTTDLSSFEFNVDAINESTNEITLSWGGGTPGFNAQPLYLIESTASTSSPSVTATGIAGTWSGLGTKEMTYTISTAPTDNKTNILINYSRNYPSGKGIEHVPSEVLEAEVNGQKLTKQGNTVVVRANFEGKTLGNVDRIPHMFKSYGTITLLSPSSSSWIERADSKISSLDSAVYSSGTTNDNGIAKHLFSFNLIRLIEDKFGEGFFADCLTTADKVAKLKNVLSRITANWYGYGSSPSGNKATLKGWANNSWFGSHEHTSGSIDKLTRSVRTTDAGFGNFIDSNGFTDFLAHAEASDGTTASTIHTDYVELEVELNAAETGYEVLQPVHKMPVLSDSPLLHKEGENILPPFTDSRWSLSANARVLDNPYELELSVNDGSIRFSDLFLNVQQNTLYSFSIQTNSELTRAYFQSVDSNGTTTNLGTVNGSGSLTRAVPTNRLRIRIDNNSNNGTFTFKQPKLELGSQATPFTPSKIRNKRRNLLDFRGKVAGSTWENPNRAYQRPRATFDSPSDFIAHSNSSEFTSFDYGNVNKLDGNLSFFSSVTEGIYRQNLYEFDLSHLGLSLSELKKALRKITISVTGWGVGDNAGVLTYGANLKIWRASDSVWLSQAINTSNSPSTMAWTNSTNSTLLTRITNNQKIYVLTHSTHPAGASSPSEIYSDYIKCEVELSDYVDYHKSNILKIRPSTKEIKLQYPTVDHRGGRTDDISLFYNHKPKQKITSLGSNVTELTQPNEMYITTVGTGKATTETNRLIYEILNNSHEYLGQSLHGFIQKGLKKLPIETDELLSQLPETNHAAYLALTPKLVKDVNDQLYMRIFYKESKENSGHINLTKTIDIPLSKNVLVKGDN